MPLEQFFGLLLSIIVSAVGLGWFLRGQFTNVEARIQRLAADMEAQIQRLAADVEARLGSIRVDLRDLAIGLKGLLHTMRSHQELLAVVFGSLHKAGALSSEDTREIVKIQSGALPHELEAVVERVMRSANPFTPEEGERLKGYIRRAREGDLFSPGEARDFLLLSDRLAQEVPEEPGVWPLVTLAGFLVGLSLGT